MDIYTYICLSNMCVYGHIYTNVCLCMSAYILVPLYTYIHTHMYAGMYVMCVCRYIYAGCLYTDLCMSVHIHT